MIHRLLLADDSVTIQRVIELTFSGENVQVLTVGDGEQAIARIQADRPDIVLADIGMPKRSGYDVAAFVKGHPDLKHIPVLLLAGAFEPVDNARAEQVGCDGVLVKPFEPQHVIARVRELLDGVKGSGKVESPQPIPERRAESPAPIPEPRAESPKPAEPVDDPLDDYFERLNTAFTTMNGNTVIDIDAPDDDRSLPTLDEVLAKPAPPIEFPVGQPPAAMLPLPRPVALPPIEPPDASPTIVASGFPPSPGYGGPAEALRAEAGSRTDEFPGSGRTVIADAFAALLALEAGEPGARPVRLTTGPEQPVVTEALIEEVTRRVLQQLAPDAARDVVVQVVSDVAERLVRDEITRIRGK